MQADPSLATIIASPGGRPSLGMAPPRAPMRSVAAASLLMAAQATPPSERDVLAFDFGWMHRTGMHDWAGPDMRPPAHVDVGTNPREVQPAYNDSGWLAVQLPDCIQHVGVLRSSGWDLL